MILRRILTLFTAVLLLGLTMAAQTIAPAPTAAGYPFWGVSGDTGKVTRGKDGNIWFLNTGRVVRMSPKSGSLKTYIVDINPDGSASVPTAISWGTDGNVWFGTFAGYVGKLVLSTGAVTKYKISSSPINDLTAGPDGNMWAVAGLSIHRISTSGSFTTFATFFASGRTTSFIRTGPDGNMWYMETFGRQIGRISTAGSVKNVWNLSGYGDPSCGPTCAALTAGPDGNIWFTQNEGLPQIGRITMSGAITYFPLQGKGAGDIVWGHDGALWFADPNDHLVGRITTSGVVTYYAPVGQSSMDTYLSCLSSSPDGNIYFTGGSPNGGSNGYFSFGLGKIPLWIPEHATGINIYPTHGTSFSGPVGTFSDFEVDSSGYFSAVINWGDGHSTKGYVSRTSTGSPNYYKVSGTHTYTYKGLYNITISVKEPGDKWKFTMSSQASVQ